MRRPTVATLGILLLAAGAPAAGAQAAPPDTAAGRRVFETTCSACHSLVPPAQLAPPMTHVARHYREAYPDRDRFIERVVAFVRAPSADSSALPAMARERFGLMPALPLPDEQLRAVAAYLWTLEAPMPAGHGDGAGHGAQGHAQQQGHGQRGRPPGTR